jgi:branched-chain amino acid transport system ATP-binding protein
MADHLLKVSNLHKHFGGIAATEDVNLAVEQGQIHAIIGPNGAGKTTLIAQLSGQIRPDSGDIEFGGRSIVSYSMARRARGVGTLVPDHQCSHADDLARECHARRTG